MGHDGTELLYQDYGVLETITKVEAALEARFSQSF
jgi:hypothetical protein